MALLQLTSSQHVHGLVVAHTQQPGKQPATSWLIRRRVAPQFQERLLDHLFGGRTIVQQAQRERVQTAAVTVVDHFQGARVALRHSVHE